MKNILIFSTAYFPAVGGAEIAVKEISDRLNNFNFDLITARIDKKLSKEEKIGQVMIYRVGFGWGKIDKFLLPCLGYLKAKKLHQKNKYQIIWSIMASQASIAAVFFKKRNPKLNLLLTLQEGDEEEHLKRYVAGNEWLYKKIIRPWHTMVMKKADYCTTISQYLKDRALKNGLTCPVEIIPNGVDLRKFSSFSGQEEIEKKRQELGLFDKDKLIIHTGRYVMKNGLDKLILALRYLDDTFKLLLIGRGQDEEKLKKIVKDNDLNKRVIFHDYVDHDELPKYLLAADYFCRPSLSEGLGNSFLEAMALELPVVATAVGGIPDFLFNEKTGLFCEVENAQSIALAIKKYEENPELKKKIIKQAKALVWEKYNWDNIARQMEKNYV